MTTPSGILATVAVRTTRRKKKKIYTKNSGLHKLLHWSHALCSDQDGLLGVREMTLLRIARIEHPYSVKPQHDQCDLTFCTGSQLEEHLKEKHTIPCTICDTKLLRSKTDLDYHMKACHSFACTNCTQIFKTNTELLDHIKTTHIIKCPNCDLTSSTQSELKEHTEESHNFPCGMCSETFAHNKSLLEHLEANHTFPCDHCEPALQQ